MQIRLSQKVKELSAKLGRAIEYDAYAVGKAMREAGDPRPHLLPSPLVEIWAGWDTADRDARRTARQEG